MFEKAISLHTEKESTVFFRKDWAYLKVFAAFLPSLKLSR